MLREMTEINGLSKAKRLSWFGPQNLVSYTYMKRLREHDDTRKVYDCDPYVEVYQFRDNLYGLFVPNCDGAGDVWQWLTIGPEKCLLVDTGFGLGHTKALVARLWHRARRSLLSTPMITMTTLSATAGLTGYTAMRHWFSWSKNRILICGIICGTRKRSKTNGWNLIRPIYPPSAPMS